MKKVNWPSKREIIGSTWVVIAGTIMLAALLWVVNLMFGALFQLIGILETGS
jgi:preprotein translocase SecE subunit